MFFHSHIKLMETSTNTLTYICVFLFSLLSYSYVMKKYKAKQQVPQPQLPPGSMGWPYIGETLQLYSQDPNVFFASKHKRYGEIFKTHILGCPCIMLASPEAARFVLVTHAPLFKPTYPKSKEELIGPSALFFHQGEYHTRIRKLVQNSLSPEVIKRIIPDIEAAAVSSLESWAASGQVIHVFHEMKKVPLTSGKLSVLYSSIKTIMDYVVTKFPNFSFNVAIITIFGHDLKDKYKDLLKEKYRIIDKGYNSFPTRIPGTAYSKALKARKRLGEILSEIIRHRKERGLVDQKDLLSYLFNYEDDKGQTLTEDQIADNVIGVLFAAQDTTASVLTWILNYMHDNKKLLQEIKAEQMEIYEANDQGRRPLTLAQTRNMPLTYRVILESLRVASIISFTFREAVVDVSYKGYLIPKGWKVLPLFRNIHYNPEFFTAPEKFDPSRFEVAPKPNTFLPFGNGVHSCPGNGLTKLDILIFIHHLVTKFRWDVLETQGGIQYSPFPVPRHGLPARFWKEPQTSNKTPFPMSTDTYT